MILMLEHSKKNDGNGLRSVLIVDLAVSCCARTQNPTTKVETVHSKIIVRTVTFYRTGIVPN